MLNNHNKNPLKGEVYNRALSPKLNFVSTVLIYIKLSDDMRSSGELRVLVVMEMFFDP